MSIRDELIEAFDIAGYNEIGYLTASNLVDALAQTLTANGLQIVPVEPTNEMNLAASEYAADSDDLDDIFELIIEGRKAMLAAAPNPLAEADGEDG